jgi:hypothetical protein
MPLTPETAEPETRAEIEPAAPHAALEGRTLIKPAPAQQPNYPVSEKPTVKASRSRSVEVRIASIEVRATAPSPPAPAPTPQPQGFDNYMGRRNYITREEG